MRIAARLYPPAPEQIQIAVAVKISGNHAATAGSNRRQQALRAYQTAFSVIHVQPVLVLGPVAFVYTPATDDVQIRVAVGIGVKKQCPHVLQIIGTLYFFGEGSVLFLQVKFAGTSRIGTDENVIQPVAVGVGNGQTRAIF